MSAPAIAYCINGSNPSSYWNTILFGADSETRYPGDICVANVTKCYGKATCVNGTCVAANSNIGAPCQDSGDCAAG